MSTATTYAETYVKACGVLKYEKTFEEDSDKYEYAIYTNQYTGNFRFELSSEYLPESDLKELNALRKKAQKEKKIMGGCAKGSFGGNFKWSGFDAGVEEVTRLQVYDSKNTVYFYYKNYDY